MLAIFYLIAILADFVAPYHFDYEVRENSYHPPTPLHFFDQKGAFHLRPFIYNAKWSFNQYYQRIYEVDTSRAYSLRFFTRGSEYRLFGLFKTSYHLFGVDGGGMIYLLGADSRGRDVLTRLLWGSRVSLSIGLVGIALVFPIGLVVGGIAGYFGGKVDDALMRLCEMVMMVPGFYLMLALRAAFPPKLSSVQVYLLIVVIMSFIGWAGLARVVRGMVLSIKEREFVMASVALGSSRLRVIISHILPNTLSYTLVAMCLSIPSYILGESALSLIGLGITEPHASWGNMLSEAMALSEIRFHPWMLLPGLFIFVTVMSFNLLGDGLQEVFGFRRR